MNLRYRIYDLRAEGANDGHGIFEWSCAGDPAVAGRVADPRSGGRTPGKVLGIKVRQALSGFVRPKSLKKYFMKTGVRSLPMAAARQSATGKPEIRSEMEPTHVGCYNIKGARRWVSRSVSLR
jgi:hypothetical protein